MRRHLVIKNLLLVVIGSAPLLFEAQYWFQAMQVSRLEQWNWLFLGCWAIFFFSALFFTRKDKDENFKLLILFALIAAVGFVFGQIKNVHGFSIISGIVFFWCVVGVFRGWNFSFLLIPSWGIFLLSCPSVSYYLSAFSFYDGFVVKLIMMGVLLLLQMFLVKIYHDRRIPKFKVCFFFLLFVGTMLSYFYSPPGNGGFDAALCPKFKKLKFGSYIGAPVNASIEDRRFFKQTHIERFYFLDQLSRSTLVLKVSKIKDVHNIHPLGYCLRAGNIKILKEHYQSIRVEAKQYTIWEIITDEDEQQKIYWQWYTTDRKSTGSFLTFRCYYSPKDSWTVIQMVCNVETDLDSCRNRLKNFIEQAVFSENVLSVHPVILKEKTTIATGVGI